MLGEHARREAKVLEDGLHKGDDIHFPRLFFEKSRVAEAPVCVEPSFL